MASQQLYSYLGRAGLWRNISNKLAQTGTQLAPCDARALKDLCAGVTWMQRVPPALLASYRALYVILSGEAADAEDEINRDIMRTVRGTTGLLLDVSSDESRNAFAGSINRVLNALAHVDDMGYCQGQNYVVDVMMKAGLPERETFCLFLYLLRHGHFHGMYRKEVAMLAGYMDKLEEKLKEQLPNLAAHFDREQYPPPLYALEWITTFFGLAAQPLVSLLALDLILAGARNPVLRICLALLGEMEEDLLGLDQEGLLKGFRSKALGVDAEGMVVRVLTEGGRRRRRNSSTAPVSMPKRPTAGEGVERELGWSTGPDYLLVLRSRNCQTLGLVELREEAQSGLLAEHSSLQDALLAVTRSLGWGRLRTCWLESCLVAQSDRERHSLANEALRFVITNGGHVKAAAFMLGVGGADANAVDSRLLSPLHLVALFNRPDVARVLLMCGASQLVVGGISRAAAAHGKLWSPLHMAEEACTEGGSLDEAGVATGPAALFILQGQVCLQCNVKNPKLAPCEVCKLRLCKYCQRDHFCAGKVITPRGVAERNCDSNRGEGGGGSTAREPSDCKASSSTHEGSMRWELGSAIVDDWEESKRNVQSMVGISWGAEEERGDGQGWKPGRLRRTPSIAARAAAAAAAAEELGLSMASSLPSPVRPWSTLSSAWLGTWDRWPRTLNPQDRDKLFENSAMFVRAFFPAQTWLQYHMEEEMGLDLGNTSNRRQWGGSFKGLGINGEQFNPEIMRSSVLTELHRRMSWVMSEVGVPWEENDDTWCCPECFILYSINVFRHHCRGCGQVFCSAHAPPTPVPQDGRSLKLCWSCVLEGAVPLPDSLLGDDENKRTMISLSPKTARRLADDDLLSPTVAAGGTYAAPEELSPDCLTRNNSKSREQITADDGRQHAKKKEVGIMSALVSLIEVVASPPSPRQSRGDAPGARKASGSKGISARQPAAALTLDTQGDEASDEPREGNSPGGRSALASANSVSVEAHPGGPEWQGAELSPLVLRKEYDPESGSRTRMSSATLQKEFVEFYSLSTEDTMTEDSGDDCADRGALGSESTNAVDYDDGVGAGIDEKPAELGFRSSRPWAHRFKM